MIEDGVLVLSRGQVAACLADRYEELLMTVRSAYEAHAAGAASVPFSLFLTDPSRPGDRIVGMPASLRTGEEVAGMKWISSFPGNVSSGKDRASSVIAVNSLTDGRVTALMEGSEVNFARTGASAALAARTLHTENRLSTLGVIGCGPINLAIVRHILAAYEHDCRILLFDAVEERADAFAARVRAVAPAARTEKARSADAVLGAAPWCRSPPTPGSRTSRVWRSARPARPSCTCRCATSPPRNWRATTTWSTTRTTSAG